MRIVFISDTHGRTSYKCGSVCPSIPDGDLLIHCGDHSGLGTDQQMKAAADWLGSLPHPNKVAIAGNHDLGLYLPHSSHETIATQRLMFLDRGIFYLDDVEATVGDLRIYGSAYTPEFCGWAFMEEEYDLQKRWTKIPAGLDILVTHGLPQGVLDRSTRGHPCGSDSLFKAVMAKRPRIHAFGHIHEGYGFINDPDTLFVNAAMCDVEYRAVNRPIVVDYDPATRKVEVVQ